MGLNSGQYSNKTKGTDSGRRSGLRLDTQVQYLKGVGPKLGDVLRRKGVETIQDLLEWYPRAYEDRRMARNIASLKPDETVSLKAQVLRVSSFYMGKSKRKIYDLVLSDPTGKIHCKYFRIPYKGYFERFQPNQVVRVIGKVSHYKGQIEFLHPDIQDVKESRGAEGSEKSEKIEDNEEEDGNKLIPIYPESEGLTNRSIRKLTQFAIAEIKKTYETENFKATKKSGEHSKSLLKVKSPKDRNQFNVPDLPAMDRLPNWLCEKYSLCSRMEALQNLHSPPHDAGQEFVDMTSQFHKRIIFEEFFWLELYLASRKTGLKKDQAPILRTQMDLVERFKKNLPFHLTAAQERAFQEIVLDLTKGCPMHRLVQGDVGSGKTVVALMASLIAIENKFQAAIMVPTEILAEQHELNAKKFLEPLGVQVGLLTGSMKASERKQTYEMLKNGMIQVVIGTHALIQDSVEFSNLGFVVIDEQHRFGVHQRSQLKAKGMSPHFLVMTATPIPRTLAMTVYGDLDVSIIDELPPGRSPIQTRVTFESKRTQMMQFLGDQIAKGRQAYIVYPLVEESEKIDLKNAVEECEKIRQHFSDKQVGLLHGKMKSDEKEEIMRRFRSGEFQILVSTTVIEVGVDVPNANLMIVEHAERFGLSQLHQLRGRVGRGAHKSFCILMCGYAVSDESRARLEIMEKTTDGFKIAEADLEIRGPGEFLGARQSGLTGFKMANLVRDVRLLQSARTAAFEVFEVDPQLRSVENQILRTELLRAHGPTALASVG